MKNDTLIETVLAPTAFNNRKTVGSFEELCTVDSHTSFKIFLETLQITIEIISTEYSK